MVKPQGCPCATKRQMVSFLQEGLGPFSQPHWLRLTGCSDFQTGDHHAACVGS